MFRAEQPPASRLPPRYRGHEETLARSLGVGEVVDAPLRRGLAGVVSSLGGTQAPPWPSGASRAT